MPVPEGTGYGTRNDSRDGLNGDGRGRLFVRVFGPGDLRGRAGAAIVVDIHELATPL